MPKYLHKINQHANSNHVFVLISNTSDKYSLSADAENNPIVIIQPYFHIIHNPPKHQITVYITICLWLFYENNTIKNIKEWQLVALGLLHF